MRKLIVILIVYISMVGCNTIEHADAPRKRVDYRFDTYMIDSCEYVVYSDGYRGGITHKGNCKFCKTRKITH